MQRTFTVMAVCLLAVLHSEASGQCFESKFYEATSTAFSNFGGAVDIDGDVLAASSADTVSIYRHDGTDWQLEQRLTFPDVDFGHSLSISGNWLLVGAPNAEQNGITTGGAALYEFDGRQWRLHQMLFPDDGSTNDFGLSVAIDGSLAVVGAPIAKTATIYRDFGLLWQPEQVFQGFDNAFGFTVAISEQHAHALVGTGGSRAFLYNHDTFQWLEAYTYSLSTNLISDMGFGSFSGGQMLVAIGTGFGSGLVNVYDETLLVDTLSRPGASTSFGHALDVEGCTVVIADRTLQTWANQVGTGYVYDCNLGGCSLRTTLYGLSPQSSLGFSDVAISGETVVLGDDLDDRQGIDAGAVYTFSDDSSFQISAPLQSKAGAVNNLVVTCADPNAEVELYFGTSSGSTTISAGCSPTVTVEIDDAQSAGVFDTDGNGNTYPNVFIPISAQGQQYIIQAVSNDGNFECRVSNTITVTFD